MTDVPLLVSRCNWLAAGSVRYSSISISLLRLFRLTREKAALIQQGLLPFIWAVVGAFRENCSW